MARTLLVYHSALGSAPPQVLHALCADQALELLPLADMEEVGALVNRSFPAGIVLETAGNDGVIELCYGLKRDAFSAIVPVAVLLPADSTDLVLPVLEAGADEVLPAEMNDREKQLRLMMMLRRADRDVSVHPTTRLPGTPHIERDMGERIRRKELFAVCYADLDHFKEFNDRYGYNEGDRVIRMLARILRDVVKGHSPDGFIGHIGGDDFIFNVPIDHMDACCEHIIEIFDLLIPFQYTEDDRRAGYFLGRDRRGNILWVPLMTLSIGVVTNRQREFTHTARVSELATEMKTFAKKQSGSVYCVDRRTDAADAVGYYARPHATADELEASKDA
jgi:GGDEF domain-containing protein